MDSRITIDRAQIEDFCQRWHITDFALFGSVLRDDFGPNSDVDVLVCFAPGTEYSIFDLTVMQDELSEMLGRSVDLVEWESVERSENYIRRGNILGSLEHVYVA